TVGSLCCANQRDLANFLLGSASLPKQGIGDRRRRSSDTAAILPTNAMNSRRLMASPAPRDFIRCEKNITNLDRELCRSLHPRGPLPMSIGSEADVTRSNCNFCCYPTSRHC